MAVTADLGRGVEDLDVGGVPDPPPAVEETPGQIELLVAVEQVGVVATRRHEVGPANRTGSPEEVADRPGAVGIAPARPWHVAPCGPALVVDQAEGHDRKLGIPVEPVDDQVGRARREHGGVIVQEPEDLAPGGLGPGVAAARNPPVLLELDPPHPVGNPRSLSFPFGSVENDDHVRAGSEGLDGARQPVGTVPHGQDHPGEPWRNGPVSSHVGTARAWGDAPGSESWITSPGC